MFDKLKQLNELRKKQKELEAQLEAEIVEVEAGDGLITIEINGAQKVTNVTVRQMPSSIENFNEVLKEAINKAVSESQKIAAEKGKALFKDLGLGL